MPDVLRNIHVALGLIILARSATRTGEVLTLCAQLLLDHLLGFPQLSSHLFGSQIGQAADPGLKNIAAWYERVSNRPSIEATK